VTRIEQEIKIKQPQNKPEGGEP